MANDTNVFTVVGRLTRDAELNTVKNGLKISKFSIASNEKYKEQEAVNFFNCVMFGKQAEALNQYLKKGNQILVVGRMKQSRWQDPDGINKSNFAIQVEKLQFLAKAKGNDNGSQGGETYDSVGYDDDATIPF